MSDVRDPTIDFDPGVWPLFDRYVHGDIDRRTFLREAARFTTGALTATALLTLLSPRFAEAQKIQPDDARIRTRSVLIDAAGGNGQIRAYEARPADATGALPRILVIHENRGLNPHIEDVTRRFALAGYCALAPDALHPLGGYPGNEDEARARFQTLDQAKTRGDFLAAARYLLSSDGGSPRIGVVGFCWGGGMSNWLATQMPEIAAAAPFYGMAPPADTVSAIRAELLVVLAENDERINASWPDYERALQAAGTRYQLLQPPGTQHGFHNDTTPRHHPQAAAQAWEATLALFGRALAQG